MTAIAKCLDCGVLESTGERHLRGCSRIQHTPTCNSVLIFGQLCNCSCNYLSPAGNQLPEGQGARDRIRPRYDLVPLEFDNELASIFEEGRRPRPGFPEGYGDSWKLGGEDFLRDCLNHALWHLKKYMDGDRAENHLAKAAWGCLAVRFHDTKK